MNNEFLVGLTYADRLRMATEARHQGLSLFMASELAELTTLMGPMSDGPEWPASPAWIAARHGANGCVISDGLSDPWVERDRPETGRGLEVFIESPDAGVAADRPLASLADTWLFPMTAEISHTLAGNPKLCERLVKGELTSLEFNIEHIKDGRGRVGALLNMAGASLTLPGGKIRLASATLLTAAELRFLRGKGEAGRHELAEKLNAAGIGHLSILNRPSLI
ncbi:MAG: hypothetical protein PHW13_01940 [Methylococcales bacterium]|nr:hypothetical protein [Methylococcales bacterium]